MATSNNALPSHVGPTEFVAVSDLYSLYCHTFDSNDAQGCAALFAPQATFTAQGREPVVGRPALEQFFGAAAARSPGTRHHVSNIVLQPRSVGHIAGRAYVLALRIAETGIHLAAAGTYRDTFTFDGQRWLFASRYFIPAIGNDLAGALLAGPRADP